MLRPVRTPFAAALLLVALSLPSGLSAEDDRVALDVPLGPGGPAAVPPLCSDVEHVGRIGYLVDQAWQAYRRSERSSPLRVGWCACAKRCEPIDRLAASYEKTAFAAKALSVDLSVPPAERAEYGRISTRMFAERNETVWEFNSCVDKTRPPLQPPTRADAGAHEIPARCQIDVQLTPKQLWKTWCGKYQAKFDALHKQFSDQYGLFGLTPRNVEYRFDMTVFRGGTTAWQFTSEDTNLTDAEKLVWDNRLRTMMSGLPRIPSGALQSEYSLTPQGTMSTIRTLSEKVHCPDA